MLMVVQAGAILSQCMLPWLASVAAGWLVLLGATGSHSGAGRLLCQGGLHVAGSARWTDSVVAMCRKSPSDVTEAQSMCIPVSQCFCCGQAGVASPPSPGPHHSQQPGAQPSRVQSQLAAQA